VKRLVENDLYVKYKWKLRKIEFLGVVIGTDGIKIEKEMMKRLLDWPMLYWKILFCKRTYYYKVLKYLRSLWKLQWEDFVLLDNASGSLKSVSTQEIV